MVKAFIFGVSSREAFMKSISATLNDSQPAGFFP
jgi:hypothetical protein